jgi:prepilin-type N-terminal cleavage/methylation domain-containing protein
MSESAPTIRLRMTVSLKLQARTLRAFTLIELLVVISIIGLLAALLFPVIGAVDRIKRTHRAKSELAQIESFIESYKSKLGYYPPDNRNPVNSQLLPGLNPLYYELDGTFQNSSNTFVDKDLAAPPLSTPMISSFFGAGVRGFMNCDRGNSEEANPAKRFLQGLKPGQTAIVTGTNEATKMTVTAMVLTCTVPGPDPNSPPLGDGSPALNPWRYNSSAPTNNPSSYDLWVDIFIGSRTYRICNWSSPFIVK